MQEHGRDEAVTDHTLNELVERQGWCGRAEGLSAADDIVPATMIPREQEEPRMISSMIAIGFLAATPSKEAPEKLQFVWEIEVTSSSSPGLSAGSYTTQPDTTEVTESGTKESKVYKTQKLMHFPAGPWQCIFSPRDRKEEPVGGGNGVLVLEIASATCLLETEKDDQFLQVEFVSAPCKTIRSDLRWGAPPDGTQAVIQAYNGYTVGTLGMVEIGKGPPKGLGGRTITLKCKR